MIFDTASLSRCGLCRVVLPRLFFYTEYLHHFNILILFVSLRSSLSSFFPCSPVVVLLLTLPQSRYTITKMLNSILIPKCRFYVLCRINTGRTRQRSYVAVNLSDCSRDVMPPPCEKRHTLKIPNTEETRPCSHMLFRVHNAIFTLESSLAYSWTFDNA